jgi:FecR protein
MPRQVKSSLALITAVVLAAVAGAFAESHVRIVRLSYLNGQVQTDRATGQGLERAILNTPIVQGMRIVTGNDGLAEVEFENESALRIAENADVEFRTLSMSDTGAKVNEIEVVKGVVYLDARSKGDDIYRIKSGDSTFLVQRDTQLRLSVSPEQTRLAVFKGDVQLVDQPQMVNVKRKETFTVDPANPSEYKVATGAEALSTDDWNREREAYQQAYANNAGNPGPRVGYGLQDLNYYGNYFMVNGYGYVWQPFGFANSMLGWDPYSSGAWIFSPGLGYAFASAYPWGWLPYHYGSWAFLGGGIGWAWIPGGGYGNGWYNNKFQAAPIVAKAPSGWTAAAPPAVAASESPKPTVMVGKTGSAAYIPGGRIPPAFSSVIHGHSVGASATGPSLNRTAVQNHTVNEHAFTANYNAFGAGHVAPSRHVFVAPPTPGAMFASSVSAGPGYAATAGQGSAVPAASSGHASSSHGSGPSHH